MGFFFYHDTSACWWERQETLQPPVSSSQPRHSLLHHLPLPLRLSVFLPGPLVRLTDDRVGRKTTENPLSCCFSDPDLTLCLLWFDRGEDRSRPDMTHWARLHHTAALHPQRQTSVIYSITWSVCASDKMMIYSVLSSHCVNSRYGCLEVFVLKVTEFSFDQFRA